MRTVALAVVATLVASSTYAQSLADAAKKAGEARAKQQTSGAAPTKVITNKDLAPASAPRLTTGAPNQDPSLSATKAAVEEVQRAAELVKDESYWKARRRELQDKLDADSIQVATLAARLRIIDQTDTSSFVERVSLSHERQAGLTTLAGLIAVVTTDRLAIARLEEDARRAGVPPGWLRP